MKFKLVFLQIVFLFFFCGNKDDKGSFVMAGAAQLEKQLKAGKVYQFALLSQ